MKANYKLNEGDQIDVEVPDPEPLDIAAENIPLDILYEDEDILIVNKPRGWSYTRLPDTRIIRWSMRSCIIAENICPGLTV